jgi:hypothetical protein
MVEAQAISDLYRLPLGDFTRARDELSAGLAKSDDKDGAKEIKGLRKPTVAAWAVNQLAFESADDLRELFELRDSMRGTSDAAELRSASQDRRRLVSKLSGAARDILESAGHAATAATLDKISQTLQAGESPEEQELILAGRLTKELAPSGLEGFPMAALESVDLTEEKEDSRARKKAEKLAAEADAAEREAEALEWAADTARQEARKAERAAAAATRKAAAARERAEKAARDAG